MADGGLPPKLNLRKLNKSHAEVIWRVRKYFEEELHQGKRTHLRNVVERTAAAIGASTRTVSKLKVAEDVENCFGEYKEKIRVHRPSAVLEEMRIVVRKVRRDLFLEKRVTPTLDTIFEGICVLKVDDVLDLNLFNDSDILCATSNVWRWSRTTLYRFMKSIGFVYGDRMSHYEHAKNREDIYCMRDDYLDWISYYRSNDYAIYYQDEISVFKNMTSSKAWKDIVGNSTDNVFNVPSGKGDRSILCHIGCAETGLLEDSMLLFRGSKSNKSSDYHSDMNWEVFSNCCENIVFPKLKSKGEKAVVVLDRATYHTVLDEEDRRPTTAWKKQSLVDRIRRWGGAPDNWPFTWSTKKKKTTAIGTC